MKTYQSIEGQPTKTSKRSARRALAERLSVLKTVRPTIPFRLGADNLPLLSLAAILVGLALRIYLFVANTSLSEDEISLSLNIATRDFGGLLRALDLHQSAPVGFLWAVRLAVVLFGVHDFSLRLVPFVCAIAALPVAWFAARPLVGDRGAFFFTALLAVSPLMLTYSVMVKQYGADALVTVLLLLLAGRNRKFWQWAVGGAVALFASMPAIFVLAGLWIHRAQKAYRSHTPRFWPQWFAVGAIWAAVFLTLYTTVYEVQANSGYMQLFWGPTFLSASHHSPAEVARIVAHGALGSGFALDANFPWALFAASSALFLVGLMRFPLLAGLPLAGVILASFLGKWVIGGRFMLFYVPLEFLAIAAGMDIFASYLGLRFAPAFLALVITFFPLKFCSWIVRHPALQTPREAVRFAMQNARAGDSVYCYGISIPAWVFYTTRWEDVDEERLEWYRTVSASFGDANGNVKPRSTPIVHEGFDARHQWNGHWELIGLPDGLLRTAAGPRPGPPDEGWLANEVQRLRGQPPGRVILVGLSVAGGRGFADLEQKLLLDGAKVVAEHSGVMTRVVVMSCLERCA